MSDKERIYALAKKYNIEAKELVDHLNKKYHLKVKSALSSVGHDIVEKLDKDFKNKTQTKKTSKPAPPNNKKKFVKKEKGEETMLPPEAVDKEREKIERAKQLELEKKLKKKEEEEESTEEEGDRKKKILKKLQSQKFRKVKFKPDETDWRRKRKKKAEKKKTTPTDADINKNIKKTLAKIESGGKLKKYKKKQHQEVEQEEDNTIKITELATVSELAKALDLNPTKVIAKCMELGYMVTINQRLEKDLIELIAEDTGHTVEFMEEYGEDELEDLEIEGDDYRERAPVVTIMGHVDHGKTLLLDYVRKANVVAGESGGITQHIGAYNVKTKYGKITFVDTPGHKSFTAMRARGSQITDIVILIVAADDGVMPQTEEAIAHAKAAEVPIIVAINKIDRPNARVEEVKNSLSKYGLLIEEWGGEIMAIPISAKTGENVDALLEAISLQAEILELKAYYDVPARGVILESQLDKGYGAVATVLIQHGEMRVGDVFVAGMNYGRVKTILDVRNRKLKKAGPSTPVKIAGFNGKPEAGDKFNVVEDEQRAKQLSMKRQQIKREQEHRMIDSVSFNNLFDKIQEGNVQALNLLLKGDTDGSIGALADTFMKMSTSEIKVNVIHKAIGDITENDILLASASNAVIIGFHVKAIPQARELAKQEHVEIRTYKIIYEAIEDLQNAMEGMLAPEQIEVYLGKAEILQIFYFSKIGQIAGCRVLEGKIIKNGFVRVSRDGEEIFEGKLQTLKHVQEDRKEIKAGYECGITFENWNDPQAGDVIECFKIEEKARKLDFSEHK